jgi:transposase
MLKLPEQLPDDLEALKQLISLLYEELTQAERRKEQLQHHIDELVRRLFGQRAEKVDPNQLQLLFTELKSYGLTAEAQEEPVPEVETREVSRRKGTGRRRLPAELPRERVEHDLPATERVCKCCSGELSKIGETITEQLEYEPATLRVLEHVRFKYACRACEENVVTAALPEQPIAKGLAGPGLLAHVLTSKYCDHLPLNRLEGIFARQGVELSRSTLCDWVGACADRLAPIVEHSKAEILKSKIIHTDDTTVPVLDPHHEKTRTGRLWVYIGDRDHEHVVFDFTPDRKRDGPSRFLEGYTGYLQADAYSGYDGLFTDGGVIEVACWAHARRKFFEARNSYKKMAFTGLAFIRQLYQVEKKAKDLSVEERRAYRQQHAWPILKAFSTWLDAETHHVLPKSPLGQAITYAKLQWKALCRYLDDGALAIDNNLSERTLRCVAIGRKNWMFTGNDDGGRRAATIYSPVCTCKYHGIDPFAYLRDVLRRLPTHPTEAIAELSPLAWMRAQHQLAAAA